MNEIKQKIPARLESAVKGGYVAGAKDIVDDALGKAQSVINEEHEEAIAYRYTKDETYSKAETYSKEQLNNLITTPEQQYVTVESYNSLPEPGTANTVYRVANYDGSEVVDNKYAEYAWDGSEYKLLAVKSYGIDTIPIDDSHNLVESGGVSFVQRKLKHNVETIVSNIGNMEIDMNNIVYIDNPNTVNGGLQEVNNVLQINTTTGYDYGWFAVEPGEIYRISVRVTSSVNYPYYVFAVDENGVIKGQFIPKNDSGTSYNTENITIPEDTTRLYIMSSNGGTYLMRIGRYYPKDIQSQLNTLNSGKIGYIISINSELFNYDTVSHTLSIPSSITLYGDRFSNRFQRNPEQESLTIEDVNERDIFIVYNSNSNLFRQGTRTDLTFDENDYIVGFIDVYGKFVFNFNYTVNNVSPIQTDGFAIGQTGDFKVLYDRSDSNNRYFIISPPTQFNVYSGGYCKRISNYTAGDVIVSNTGHREQLLLFNFNNNTFSTVKANGTRISDGYVVLGLLDTFSGYKHLNFEYNTDKKGDSAIDGISITSNSAYGNTKTFYPFFEDYLNKEYFPREEEGFTNLLSRINERRKEGCFQLALITDTHDGGKYTEDGNFALRIIQLFNELADKTDAFVHCGDISSDYGTSKERYFAFMQESINKYKIPSNKNFLITKGNHDVNDDRFIEISPIQVDWDNNVYYDKNFTAITKDTYRGGNLYIIKNEPISDSLFKFIQQTNCPVDAVWGDGAYYYWDVEDFKIRFIVANSFPIDDNGKDTSDDEYLWFAQTALDMSSKENPEDWLVITIRHTEATSLIKLNNIINAFITGTSVIVGETTIDYGNLNGGGINFIHLHGHEHSSAGYSNMNGYLDIGFRHGYVEKNLLGNVRYYNLYVLTIDTNKKQIISDCLYYRSATNIYDYRNNIALLNVGDTIRAARSGISSHGAAVWTSSNNNVATVDNNGWITAVGIGEATIIGVEDQKNVAYTVKVE